MMRGICRRVVKALRQKELIPVMKTVASGTALDGKCVLVTGASGGIGIAVCESLFRSWGGVNVVMSGTNEQKLAECKNTLESRFPGRCAILPMNMENITSFDEKIEAAVSIFGRIDILVHCAGVHTANVDFWTMTEKEFDRVTDINLKGSYFICQSVARYFMRYGIRGKMVLISSSRGSEPAWSPYGISKCAMDGMVKGLAKLFMQHGITVNAVAPGPTATPLLGYEKGGGIFSEENAVGRLVMPEEVANVVSLLAGDAGCMISGEVIHISAGRGVFDIR